MRGVRHVFALMVLSQASLATAQNHATVSSAQMAEAFNAFDKALNPSRHVPVSSNDVRVVRCVGPEEELTEFECTWQQKTLSGWMTRKNWLAIDGKGWHIID